MPLGSGLRIVEIGDKPLVRRAFPDAVVHFSTSGVDRETDLGGPSALALARLWTALRDPALSLVVCHPTYFAPWQIQALNRAIFNRRVFGRPFLPLRGLGPQMIRAPLAAPIAIIDQEDLPLLNRNTFFLLRRATLYFKRELPPDRWRLFLKTGHANLPTARFREQSRLGQLLEKIRPISIGLPMTTPDPFPVELRPKTVDLFFAGKIEGRSTVRTRGIREFLALRDRGFSIDIPDTPLPPVEFLRRCAQAAVTWSPEGLGWDCYRHYEAAACGSVPLINQPTIERHAPLADNVHALYYDVEDGALTRTVERAFADCAGLARMAEAARRHALAHHTPVAIATHVVRSTLAYAARTVPDTGGGSTALEAAEA